MYTSSVIYTLYTYHKLFICCSKTTAYTFNSVKVTLKHTIKCILQLKYLTD